MNDIAQSATESQNKILLIEAGTTLFALVEWARNVSPDLLKRAHKWGPDGDSYSVPIQLH